MYKALNLESCLQSAEDTARRVGNNDSLAIGGSGVLPAIQTAICRKALTGYDASVYPVRFSLQKNDNYPIIDDEVGYLKESMGGKKVTVFDEAIGWGTTMTGMLEFVANTLGRPDAMPVWSHDVQGIGSQLWPYYN